MVRTMPEIVARMIVKKLSRTWFIASLSDIFHFHHRPPDLVHLSHVGNVVLKEGKGVKITATFFVFVKLSF